MSSFHSHRQLRARRRLTGHTAALAAAAAAAAALVLGCESSGLSVRDTRGQGYSEIVHANRATSPEHEPSPDGRLQRAAIGGADEATAIVAAGSDAPAVARSASPASPASLRFPIRVA